MLQGRRTTDSHGFDAANDCSPYIAEQQLRAAHLADAIGYAQTSCGGMMSSSAARSIL
jgi:hypothetical protein